MAGTLRLGFGLLLGLSAVVSATAAEKPKPPDRSPSRLLPGRELEFYIEYDGLDAHADAWKKTAAYDVLGLTSAGATMTDVARATLDRILKSTGVDLTADDVVAVQEHLTRRGFAFASYNDLKRHDAWTALVLNSLGGKDDRARFERVLRRVLLLDGPSEPAASRDLRGRALFSFPGRPQATWWREGDSLILVQGPSKGPFDLGVYLGPRGFDPEKWDVEALHKANVEAVLDAIEENPANASTHPAIVAARAEGGDLDGFEPDGLFVALSRTVDGVLEGWPVRYVQGGAAVESTLTELIGLNEARRIVGRWGFRGKALLLDVRFDDVDDWKGMAGMLDPAGFPWKGLPPTVRTGGGLAIGAFRRALDADSLAVARTLLVAGARPYAKAVDAIFNDPENHQVITDLFRSLGPIWTVRDRPVAMLAEVRNAEKAGARLDAAAARLNVYFREQESSGNAEAKPGDPPPALVLERLPAPDHGYRLTSPEDRVPWLSDKIQPTILLDRKTLVYADSPATARAATAGAPFELSGEAARAAECLPEKVSILWIGDPGRSFWPDWIADFRGSTARFFKITAEAAPELAGGDVLTSLGVRPPAPRRPAGGAEIEAIRASIFPSVVAATVDGRSVRFIALEALPLGCLPIRIKGTADGPITIEVTGKP